MYLSNMVRTDNKNKIAPKIIPNFALYGEQGQNLFPDFAHLETIKARSEKTGWKFKPHLHRNLYQFFYIDTSAGQCQIDGKNYELIDQTMIVIPPTHIHGFVFLPGTQGWVLSLPDVHFDRIFENDLVLRSRFSKPIFTQIDKADIKDRLKRSFKDLQNAMLENDLIHTFMIKGYVAECLGLMLNIMPSALPISSKTERHISHIRNFERALDIHYLSGKSVREYADDLGITPTHLNRLCKTDLGRSASQIIADRRVLEAKRDLIYTAKTIADIAYGLGFKDPAHFSKFFMVQTGGRASHFRKQYFSRG